VAVGIANVVRGRRQQVPHAPARLHPSRDLAGRPAATARSPRLTARRVSEPLGRLTLRLAAFLTRDSISSRRRVLAEQWLLKTSVDSPRVSDAQLLRIVHKRLDAEIETRIAAAAWMAGRFYEVNEDPGKLIAAFYAAHRAVTAGPPHVGQTPASNVFTYTFANELYGELRRKLLPVVSATGPRSYISGQA